MKYLLAFPALLLFFPLAYAEIKIPDGEYAGYFDSDDIYTVVGAIKNTGDQWITPTVTITFEDKKSFSKSFSFVPIGPNSEQPFKVKFPELILDDPFLHEPKLTYEIVPEQQLLDVDVLYDDTLITHTDGHKTGRIINNGDSTIDNLKVYALIYSDEGKLLDMGQSTEIFENFEPGEIYEFSIYPDPSISSEAYYYSCFAVGDSSVVPINIFRKDEPYNFRYDSGAWFAYSTFSDDGKTLTMKTQNSFPLEMSANFELPRHSDNEKFNVLLNDESINFKQSIDEMGNWHVAFIMPPYTTGFITMTGFEDPGDVSPFEEILTKTPKSDIFSISSDNSDLYYLGLIPIVGIIAGIIVYKKRT